MNLFPHDTESTHRASQWEREVVVRRIRRPLSEISALDLLTGAAGFLGPLVSDGDGLRARAVIRLGGLAVPTVIDVAVVEWSSRVSELRIVPTSPNVARWTEHRRRRYFDIVHELADRLAYVLEARSVAA